MSDYKHGNWYCKPANEAEAREVVERAVASGAKKDETFSDWAWDAYGAWGVRNGRTHTQTVGFYRDGGVIEYTIDQVRDKFPVPGERVERSGEGVPPVGTVCSIQLAFNDMGECEIIYIGDGVYCYRQLSTKREYAGSVHDTVFRFIPSERELWVEQAGMTTALTTIK